MTITTSWLDDSESIIHTVVHDPWTYQEVGAALDTIDIMTKDRTKPVAWLSDMSHTSTTLRLELAEFRKLAHHPLLHGDRISRVHAGGIKMPVKLLTDMASPFFPRLFRFLKLYSSIEVALAELTTYLSEQASLTDS